MNGDPQQPTNQAGPDGTRSTVDQQLPVRRGPDESRFEGDLITLDRMRRCFELHAAGVSYAAIADQLGIGKTTAFNYDLRYQRLHRPIPGAGEYLDRQLAEIDLMRRNVIREAMEAPRGDRAWHFATPVLVKLQEREQRLTGFANAPTVDELEVMTDDEVNAWLNR